MLKPKIGIIGAGNVGIRYAYSLVISGVARSVVILDRDKARAEGEVLDLASGMPYMSPVEIKVGDYPDLEDADLVVITAGAKQKPGQTRLDLVRDNVEVFKEIIPHVARHAQKAVWLVVTNPVDVLSYAAHKFSGKPWQEVIGSGTVLDSSRFRWLLAKHCNIDARNVHAYILGEHGDSEFPLWSKAIIGSMFFTEYCPACHKCDHSRLDDIFKEARDYAYQIITRKGETSYGIALALVKISEAILKDENSILPVSCYLEDYHGISDVYLSVPAVVHRAGIRELLRINPSEQELVSLRKSADTIKAVIKEVGL
ncbi:MAG: L-lactate dehydrogenase [Candidatus Omnitrophica bacterium]|nr:L-lactate dehydrogenase [Candidatus Omnitrophota bacterium]